MDTQSGYPPRVQRPLKVHIVTYTCESCGADHTRPVGLATDGMCPLCDCPMRIEDLFSDRRIVSVPVKFDRRTLPEAEAA